MPNASFGVYISGGGTGNTIGGTAAAAANLISGNSNYGIDADGSTSTGNLLEDNYVGTQAGGSGTLANSNGALEITNGAGVLAASTFTGSVLDNGTLDLDGNAVSVAALNGSGTVTDSGAAATVTVTGGGSYSGTITGSNTALTLNGGTLTLSGANTYSGQTSVNGGVLTLASNTAAGTSNIVVSSTTGGAGVQEPGLLSRAASRSLTRCPCRPIIRAISARTFTPTAAAIPGAVRSRSMATAPSLSRAMPGPV